LSYGRGGIQYAVVLSPSDTTSSRLFLLWPIRLLANQAVVSSISTMDVPIASIAQAVKARCNRLLRGLVQYCQIGATTAH